jgi:SAM-dependent methyltransferase
MKTACAGRVYENLTNRQLLDMLNFTNGGTVLDCGCGAGSNARFLSSMGCKVTGITISGSECELASQFCSEVWTHNLDNGLPLEIERGTFDLVVLSHVLEHLRCPELLLRELRSVLRSGGLIAVALPNILNWYLRLQFLFGRFEYEDEGILDATHLRFFTFSSGRRLLEEAGWEVLQEKTSGSLLPWGRLRQVLPALPRFIDKCACRICPSLFGRQLLYIARAK